MSYFNIRTIRVNYSCKDRSINIKREWIRNNADYKYCKIEPMLSNDEIDSLIEIEWIYDEDV